MKTWVLAVLGTISLLGADSLAVKAKVHTIISGDWVSTIADQYNIPWSSIYALNAQTIGENPDLIYPDTTLYIPLSTSYVQPEVTLPTYYIEIWTFLALFAIFIWVYKRKEWGGSTPVEIKVDQKPVEVNVTGASNIGESTSTSRGEVGIEDIKGTSAWLQEKAKVEGKAESIDTGLDNKSDLKKLKKLRGA